MANLPLDERAQHLLKTLVELYIREGEPVGSKTLAEESKAVLSSATIRNVMAELEERGYVSSPHTSAGRIPTAAGYRFFVDCLLTRKPLDDKTVRKFESKLNLETNVQDLITTASSLLSQITKYTGLVTIPRRDVLSLRQIEFLPLSEKRVLVILVLSDHEVQNRIIYMPKELTVHELQHAANYLNDQFAGKELTAIRKELLKAMMDDRKHMDQLMQAALEVADKAFEEPAQVSPHYVLSGQSHLLNLASETNLEKVKQLFEAFHEKNEILQLLDQCLMAEGVRIFIGEESGHTLLDDCSIVTAPYTAEEKVVGVLGVIGPTRMSYDRVIQTVDLTAKLLSAALNPMK